MSLFVFFQQYFVPGLVNIMKVLSLLVKAKLVMDASLDCILSWGSFVYNVEKSIVFGMLFLFVLFNDWMIRSAFLSLVKCSIYVNKNVALLWKFLILEDMSFKTVETDLQICFVEHILDAMMEQVPVEFLCILGVLYLSGSVFFFFYNFETHASSIFCVLVY